MDGGGVAGGTARRVVMLNWRDTAHPEGGGSELYLERIGAYLVAQGREVTILCSRHGTAPRDEVLPSGVRVLRRGRRFSVYLHALARLLVADLGKPDVVVDVQNGVPFWTPLVTRRPVVLLCHHVHREQWPVVFSPLAARVGWWLESVVAPRVYRGRRYVTVSGVSKADLAELGVEPERITVVHNGVDEPVPGARPLSSSRYVLVLGRLVPHKRVELAIEALQKLGDRYPDLRLVVAGQGYWADELDRCARELGVRDRVDLVGWVPDDERSALLRSASVLLVPSLMEGWGLTVMEAAMHRTPALGFRSAGGVAESIVDGRTGLLADDQDEFVAHLDVLLSNEDLRVELGATAYERATTFRWAHTAKRFAEVLDEVFAGSGRAVAHDPATDEERLPQPARPSGA